MTLCNFTSNINFVAPTRTSFLSQIGNIKIRVVFNIFIELPFTGRSISVSVTETGV